ncbi:MAG: hypothetical protein ACNA8S_16050 [Deferrisomatales bacterium]
MPPEPFLLTPEHEAYRHRLRDSTDGRGAPQLWCLGPPRLLANDLLGLFCSTRCPGDVVLRAYEAARALRDAGIPVIGGFHTPTEQGCLELLLRGTQPVVWCPARGLPQPRRLPKPKRDALAEGRLLILSPFAAKARRMTADRAERRNELVVRLADRLLFLHAPPGTRTDALRQGALARGKPVFLGAEVRELLSPNRFWTDLGIDSSAEKIDEARGDTLSRK